MKARVAVPTTATQLEEGELAEEEDEGELAVSAGGTTQPRTVEAAQPPTSYENTAATSDSSSHSRSRSRSRSRRRWSESRHSNSSYSPRRRRRSIAAWTSSEPYSAVGPRQVRSSRDASPDSDNDSRRRHRRRYQSRRRSSSRKRSRSRSRSSSSSSSSMGRGNDMRVTAPSIAPVSQAAAAFHRLMKERQERAARKACTFFVQGRCRNGDSCRFSHAASPAVTASPAVSPAAAASPVVPGANERAATAPVAALPSSLGDRSSAPAVALAVAPAVAPASASVGSSAAGTSAAAKEQQGRGETSKAAKRRRKADGQLPVYRCPLCKKKFAHNSALYQHMAAQVLTLTLALALALAPTLTLTLAPALTLTLALAPHLPLTLTRRDHA